MSIDSFYEAICKCHLGPDIIIQKVSSVAGGCINQTSRITTNQGEFFIKVNTVAQSDLFHKEQLGLDILKEKSPLGTPAVLGSGIQGRNSYLLLEWVEKGIQNTDFWKEFGSQLATQHKVSADLFGLDHHNHIGRLHQSNKFHENWAEFFVEERLRPQLQMAHDTGLIEQATLQKFDILFNKLEELVPSESPSLLHGDLWSGNFLCGQGSRPYIFDPAVHFGHRETELAFTTMFGGFDQQFYSTYSEEYPLSPGFEDRIEVHNLYPLLVHVNLFGRSYLSGIERTLKRFT